MFLLLPIFFSSCIERYYIEEQEDIKPRVVIDGLITDGCESPEIVISRSSSTESAIFLPVSGCSVQVLDADGNIFNFEEAGENPGHYVASIGEEHLYIGNKFKLIVQTPDQERYESPFEEMLPCPPVDSVYYEITSKPTADPEKPLDGVQFYYDFEGSDYFGPYYRLMLEETYEYHSTWPKKNYISVNNRLVEGFIDYSTFTCYKTDGLDQILTLSTKAFTENRFTKGKLLFVDNRTQRLRYNYSLLVKQRSLSEGAYNYWEQLRKNEKETQGLFTKQPALVVGNIKNVGDTTAIVLGYFRVASETTKRIVLSNLLKPSFFDIEYCKPIPKDVTWPLEPRPLYIREMDWMGSSHYPAWAPTECFDCTVLGGVLERPDFFEN